MTINLQSLVTATENADLAAKDAIIAAQAAEIAKRTATMDHAGIWLLYDWRPKAEAVGRSLDLTDFTETFRDDFSVDSIMDANGSPAGGKWYSPARANFDNSSAPFNRSQVTVANGQCRIRIERISPPSSTSAWGSWRAGHMQTMNQQGQGFAQPIVPGHPTYFEARIKLPVQDIPWGWQPNTGLPLNPQSPADTHGRRGSWPSFWLLSANEFPPYDTKHLIEMDCMENYAGDQNIHSTVHLKPRRVPQAGDPPSRQTNSELSPKNRTSSTGTAISTTTVRSMRMTT
jgi:hypothetical protein